VTDPRDHAEPGFEELDLPDRWRLLARLPAGRHARVWVAEDRRLNLQVVLKVFPPVVDASARARALMETRLGERLRHPRLVELYEVVEAGQHLVAVMERMTGGSLAQRLAFEGPQELGRVACWTGQALEALAYLHELNLVHRDIKPSNLLLDDGDGLKLSDLGLVGRVDRGRYLPGGRAARGTAGYMAPEQHHEREPSPSWDLYALGVTVFQLMVGRRPPIPADTAGAVSPLVESLTDCPVWLAQFVETLLAPRPLDRWATAVEASAVFETQRRRV
jgi:serine/threonine-protein kinase